MLAAHAGVHPLRRNQPTDLTPALLSFHPNVQGRGQKSPAPAQSLRRGDEAAAHYLLLAGSIVTLTCRTSPTSHFGR